MKVKDLVKKKDHPPGKAEEKLRHKHVPEALDYNHSHAFDHLRENANKLKLMRDIDPDKAKRLGKECLAEMKKIEGEIKQAAGC